MAKVNARLLKPLDGHAIGSELEFDKADFERLRARNAVTSADEPKAKMAGKPKNKAAPKPQNKASVKPRPRPKTD